MSKIKQAFPVTLTQNSDEGLVGKLDYFNTPSALMNYSFNQSVNPFDDTYLALCEKILKHGVVSEDRTSVGTLSLFGEKLKFDLRKGFPLFTTKKINFKHVVNELLWLYSPNCYDLNTLPVESQFLWKSWADEDNYLGPIYGVNIRKWYVDKDKQPIDQLSALIENIKKNPYSRRHIITDWHVSLLDDMSLVPCHGLVTQFYIRNGELSCQMYQRSWDIALGCCYNVAQYALLAHIIAHICDLQVGDLSICAGDVHIYLNHIDGIKEQLTRTPFAPPTLKINTDNKDFDSFTADDFELVNYQHHDFIKFEVAV